jgi:hypothetical protein
MTLDEIRKLRNEVFHETKCLYYDWCVWNNDEAINEYNKDIKRAKRLLSLAKQYKDVIKRRQEEIFKHGKK